MINDVLGLGLALASGAGVGVVFFGGLWLTLQRLPISRSPMLLVMGSMVGRMGIAAVGFYLITDGNLQRLAACTLGFILMRQVFIRRLQPARSITATADK